MTLIGKLLAMLNMVVGLGILSWSVTVYTQRPGWFDPAPDSVGPGQNPENFALIKAEVESLNNTIRAAVANRATQRKTLEELEAKRADRQKKYDERLQWARFGNPKDGGNGFYEPKYEKDSGLLDLSAGGVGAPIRGTDNKPLKGSERLMDNFTADVDEVAKLAEQIVKSRNEYTKISEQILRRELELLKMTEIRESVQAELFFLASFEVNVYETRETVTRRKKQLTARLQELGEKQPQRN